MNAAKDVVVRRFAIRPDVTQACSIPPEGITDNQVQDELERLQMDEAAQRAGEGTKEKKRPQKPSQFKNMEMEY